MDSNITTSRGEALGVVLAPISPSSFQLGATVQRCDIQAMNPRSLFLAFALLAAGLGVLPAAEPVAQSGVTLSLSTSGYIFGTPPPTATASATAAVVRKSAAIQPSFTASILLWNRSARDLEFAFPSALSAQQHFVFRVFDSANALLWQSTVPTPVVTVTDPPIFQAILHRRSAWKLTQAVPLVIDGKPLPAGAYTVEGSIDGSPVFTSRATFQVLATPIAGSGIKGIVLAGPVTPVSRPGEPNEKPVAKAIIRYFNTLAASAVVTTVIADEQGHFQFAVPPGQYSVTAIIPGDENSPFGHGTQTVTVTPDHFTEITFHLDTGIR